LAARTIPDQRFAKGENKMEVANLVLPVFAIILARRPAYFA
jgi:hypothetical protein